MVYFYELKEMQSIEYGVKMTHFFDIYNPNFASKSWSWTTLSVNIKIIYEKIIFLKVMATVIQVRNVS